MPIFVIFYILFTQYYTSNNTQTPTFASKYKSIIMSTFQNTAGRMTNYRWIICAMLFFATTVNYLDRQVLSLTWKDFISPEFHWTDTHYGYITAIFSIVYALGNLFAGRFIDWMGTKKGYLWAIAVWSIGACMHALCGLATEMTLGIENAANMISATGALASTIAITSVYYFIAARIILGIGEAGNFPAAIKVTAEYFPKKDRAFSTSIFNAGSTIGALIAPLCIPTLARYFQRMGVGNGWEMAFIVIVVFLFIFLTELSAINIVLSIFVGYLVFKSNYTSLKKYYKKHLHDIDIMLPYYLKGLEILIQHYTVPVALAKSIEDAPDIFKPGLRDMIAKIDAGDSSIDPYMEFANEYPVRDSMRMMRLLYRLGLGKQEDKQERLLMFSRTVSNLQAKAREQKYKERLNHMESQTMVMLVATGAGVMVLILISMVYMFSNI